MAEETQAVWLGPRARKTLEGEGIGDAGKRDIQEERKFSTRAIHPPVPCGEQRAQGMVVTRQNAQLGTISSSSGSSVKNGWRYMGG
jgi:hypothetical protein